MDKLTSSVSERFELLSAYLDGEVSASERKQVEEWLASDPQFRQTYQKMMTLQEGLRSMPVETASVPTEELVSQVMARLDRQPQRWIWGGLGAVAVIAIGAFSGLFGNQGMVFQTAKGSDPQQNFSAPAAPVTVPNSTAIAMRSTDLLLVLDRPPVEIPAVPDSGTANGADVDPISNF